MEPIKTHSDLKKLINFLDKQGFGYISEWELHRKKINHIINKNNTLGVKHDDKVRNTLYELEDYDEIDKEAKKFFSNFSVDDKILEYIKMFRVNSDASCSTPGSSPDDKDIINWVNFKKKYNLKDEFGRLKNIDFYNLDKNYLKINFPKYKDYEFKAFYKCIFGEECAEFNDKIPGTWQNLGKIEIKFFLKGGANIKGDLKKIKEYYFKELSDGIYRNLIIKYNGKMLIFKTQNDYD